MGTFVQQLGPARGVAVLSRKCTPHASRAHFTPQRMRVAAAARTNSSAADERDQQMAVTSLLASLAGGAVGGLFGPFDEALPLAVQHVSSSLGWAYFLAWSISFYPQVVENWRRKSVTGLSSDYLVYSILGYAAYTAYTAALYFSPGVQAAYMAAHAGSAPDVQLTDFAFAAHALLVSLFTLYQCFLYGAPTEEVRPQPPQQQLLKQSDAAAVLGTSRTCQLTTAGVAAAVVFFSGHISTTCGTSDCNAWLPMLYLLGTIKVSMTLIKYTPQALLNHRRRSTEGWQINNVLLDLAGGLLSFGQIGLNALSRNDMSVVTGNPAKLGISLISIGFDVIFILQHYVLYKGSSTSSVDDASSAAAAAVGNRRLVLVPVRAEVGSSTGTGTATGRRRRAASVTANAAAAGGGAAGGVTGREQRPGRRSSCGQ